MPPLPQSTYHGYIILSTTLQRRSSNARALPTSSSDPAALLVTPTYEAALTALLDMKNEILRKRDKSYWSFCMARDTADGVDVILTPRTGEVTTEVRVKIQGVDVLRGMCEGGDGDEEQGYDGDVESGIVESGIVEQGDGDESDINGEDEAREEEGGLEKKGSGEQPEARHEQTHKVDEPAYEKRDANDDAEAQEVPSSHKGTRTPHPEGAEAATRARLLLQNMPRSWSIGP